MSENLPTDHEIDAQLRAWIRRRTRERGWSQNRMGAFLGMRSGTFSRIMDGRNFSAGEAVRIAHKLNLDFEKLFYEDPGRVFFFKHSEDEHFREPDEDPDDYMHGRARPTGAAGSAQPRRQTRNGGG